MRDMTDAEFLRRLGQAVDWIVTSKERLASIADRLDAMERHTKPLDGTGEAPPMKHEIGMRIEVLEPAKFKGQKGIASWVGASGTSVNVLMDDGEMLELCSDSCKIIGPPPEIGMRVAINAPGFACNEGVVICVHRSASDVTVDLDDLGIRDFAWRNLTPLTDVQVKSDITDAMTDEKTAVWIRKCLLGGDGRSRFNAEAIHTLEAIADLLDAMGWRGEPPDSVGWWLRDRDHPDWERYILLQVELPLNRVIHLPGDRWLKLPS